MGLRSLPLQSLKVQPEVEAKKDEVLELRTSNPSISSLVTSTNAAVQSNADYGYIFKDLTIQTNPAGDMYESVTFKVMHMKKEIGLMNIYHNRFGAFAHFTDTLSYPLN